MARQCSTGFIGWLATIILWLAKKSFWWIELDPAQDAAMREGMGRPHDDERALASLAYLTQQPPPANLSGETVMAQLLSVFPPPANTSAEQDEWIGLMQRLDQAQKHEDDIQRKAHIRIAMDLLYAFNRNEEMALHSNLTIPGATSTLTATLIKQARDYCRRQSQRFNTGVAWFPIGQEGEKLNFLEALQFYLSVIGILLINCFTETISFSFGEYVGVARNGIQRPRTLFQIGVALFDRKHFNLADGPFVWEIGRQRTLGASLSFLLFTIAFFHRPLYRQTSFIIGVGVSATLFQVLIQLGDLAWFRVKCLKVAKEARPELTWPKLILAWSRGRIPQGRQEDFNIHAKLTRLNSRSAAWARTYTKSKPMSLLWIEFAKRNAAPRYYYAARAGIVSKTVYNLAFIQKLLFPILTLGTWFLSAYALWGQWQVFTIVMAFHTIAVLKGLDLVYAPEQEVLSAANVWCNMIGAAIPAIFLVLLPRAANDTYLSKPRDLIPIMPVTFFLTQWTDLIASGMTIAMRKIFRNRN